jgi:hypothetical protein
MMGMKNKGNQLIGYCGICCSICNSYRNNRCSGCPDLDCEISKCAKSRDTFCFSCEDFPCKLHEEGTEVDMDEVEGFEDLDLGKVKWKPYSRISIKVSKLLKEKTEKVK